MATQITPTLDDFLNLADDCREEGMIALKVLGYEVKAIGSNQTRVMIIVLEDHNYCNLFLPGDTPMDGARNLVITRLIRQLHVRSGYAFPHHRLEEEAFLCHILDEIITRRIPLIFKRALREGDKTYTVMSIV